MSKEKVVLPSDGSVQSALKAIRGLEQTPSAWVVLGYSDDVTLTVIANGEGSLEEASEHLPPKDARFILIRKEHKIELANTVKFAYVSWLPDSIPPTRKAILSTHKGQVKDIMSPFHVLMECTDRRDLNEQELMNKIGFSSGTASFVTDKQVYQAKVIQPSGAKGPSHIPNEVQASGAAGALSFADDDAIAQAVAAVKSDKDPTDWCLAGYKNATTLQLLAKGEGGVNELLSKLDDAQVYYAYFRVTEKFDQSTTVKFGYVNIMTQKISPVLRAKVSTHRGFVTTLFSPFHVEFALGDFRDLTLDSVMEKIGKNTGTRSNVTDKGESLMAGKMTVHKKQDHLVNVDVSEQVVFSDESSFRLAVKNVRDDSQATNWLLAAYVGKNELALVGSGEGGAKELLSRIQSDCVNFALLRVTDQIDKSVTVKFVYIKCQPANTAPTLKAQISTKKGAIDPLFAPFHVDFFIESASELSEEELLDKVMAASGSKDHTTTAPARKD